VTLPGLDKEVSERMQEVYILLEANLEAFHHFDRNLQNDNDLPDILREAWEKTLAGC
jgi:hypothetical protein